MKEKKNIIIIICLCIIGFLIGVVVYLLFFNKETPNEEPTNTTNVPTVSIMEFLNDEDLSPASRVDLKLLLEEEGYAEEEINDAVTKVTYDWNSIASEYLNNVLEALLTSKQAIIDDMKNQEFTDSEINNAFKSLSKQPDFNKIALEIIKDDLPYHSKAQLENLLKEEKFTDSEISYAIKKLNANYYDRAVDLAKEVHLTVKKSDIKNYLLEKGFTEKEATINLDWIYQVNYGIYYEATTNNYNFAVGDFISIGGEKFNVIKSNDSETVLLAYNDIYIDDIYKDDTKYCTQTDIPSTEGYEEPGEIAFADNSYWTDKKGNLLSEFGSKYPAYVYNSKSNAYKYVEKYVSLLKNLELFSKIDGRLISYEELMEVGCEKKDVLIYCPYFVANKGSENTSYLTGSANNDCGIYYVWNDELRDHYNMASTCTKTNLGKVRPVIVVKTSELKNFYTKYKITGTYR